MEKMIKLVISAALLVSGNTALAKTEPLTDCSQLQQPKTVLLVHASWCKHCTQFLPVYEAVSDAGDMSEYTFYTKENNFMSSVCGTSIYGVPMTFTHNMSKVLEGGVSAAELKSFVQQ